MLSFKIVFNLLDPRLLRGDDCSCSRCGQTKKALLSRVQVTLTIYHAVAEPVTEGVSENLTQTAHLEELELVEFGLEDDPGLGPIEKNYQCVVQADFDNQGEVRLPPDTPLEGAECRCSVLTSWSNEHCHTCP